MIKIGIVGYGNLGRGVACSAKDNEDMELVGIFTKRKEDVSHIVKSIPVFDTEEVYNMQDKIDVLVLCGGSAKVLPKQSAALARYFNIVDSFDTHANIPKHFYEVDEASKQGQHISIVAAGWDPGLFSLHRLYGQAILPQGKDYTFWGKGVSQGHSDAIRCINGVKEARQYTIPIECAIQSVRNSENPELSPREKHTRECFVVVEDSADQEKIEETIKTMPFYFSDYETIVHFISEEEFRKEHKEMPHGGVVFRTGKTGLHKEHKHLMEFTLNLDSNPEFAGSILVAYARAAYRIQQEGQIGCKTVFDVAPKYLHKDSPQQLLKTLL